MYITNFTHFFSLSLSLSNFSIVLIFLILYFKFSLTIPYAKHIYNLNIQINISNFISSSLLLFLFMFLLRLFRKKKKTKSTSPNPRETPIQGLSQPSSFLNQTVPNLIAEEELVEPSVVFPARPSVVMEEILEKSLSTENKRTEIYESPNYKLPHRESEKHISPSPIATILSRSDRFKDVTPFKASVRHSRMLAHNNESPDRNENNNSSILSIKNKAAYNSPISLEKHKYSLTLDLSLKKDS